MRLIDRNVRREGKEIEILSGTFEKGYKDLGGTVHVHVEKRKKGEGQLTVHPSM